MIPTLAQLCACRGYLPNGCTICRYNFDIYLAQRITDVISCRMNLNGTRALLTQTVEAEPKMKKLGREVER